MDRESETAEVVELLQIHTILTHAYTIWELRMLLGQERYDVVLCGRSFRRGSWKEILKATDEEAPGVPTIVLSRESNAREWREALAAGAFDLVTLPVPQQTLLGIVEQAAASQQARCRGMHPITAQAVHA
jgi:DNA-binding NtrC family response regulator